MIFRTMQGVVLGLTLLGGFGAALISVGHHDSNDTTQTSSPPASNADPLVTTLLEVNDIIPKDNSTQNITVLTNSTAEHSESYDKLYERAIQHYLDNEWHQCAGLMKQAIGDYHWHHDTLLRCVWGGGGEREILNVF